MLNFKLCKILIIVSKVLRKFSVLFKSILLKKLWVKIAFCAVKGRSEIKNYKEYETKNELHRIEKNIFVYWEQGIDQAPDVVKKCINLIVENFSHSYKVHVLDGRNLKSYVTFPSHINDKLVSGVITKTHFSDLVRFELLNRYGGFWIDSTVLTSRSTPSLIDGRSFFTLKHSNYPEYQSFNDGLWTSYFLGLPKNSALARFMCDSFYSYWRNNDSLLDYFLVDYYLFLAYQNIDAVKNIFDEQEDFCGNNRWLLVEIHNKEVNEIDDRRLVNDKYKIYKLSYKLQPSKNDGLYYHKFFK